MKDAIRITVLLLLYIHHIYAWFNIITITSIKLEDGIENKLRVYKQLGARFLTNWNFFNQTVYISLALITTLVPKFHNQYDRHIAKLKKINWHNFWSIVFPWSLFIPTIFWSLYLYDREIIFPRIIDFVFPVWLNHAVHTNILALVVLEVLFMEQRPPRMVAAFKTMTVYTIAYGSVLCFTYFNNDIWLYKFLYLLNWTQRIVLFLGTYVFLIAAMMLGLSYQTSKYKRTATLKYN